MPELHAELVEGLRAAASGQFAPKCYRVKVSARREKRYRRPGMASPLSQLEARALQAFYVYEGCTISELARRFWRQRATVRKSLRDPEFMAFLETAE